MKRNVLKISKAVILLLVMTSCEDFLSIDPPRTELGKEGVFSSPSTADAAMLAIYNQMVFSGFGSGGLNSATYLLSMSSDELINYNVTADGLSLQEFNNNSLVATNPLILSVWSELYQYIYKANAILEGLKASTRISKSDKERLTGEAKFVRAFSHFYLVNLFGRVPVVTSSDYLINSSISRQSINDVYTQIETDLIEAEQLLPSNYALNTSERIRPTKAAATAMLARVYLFTSSWEEAEYKATTLIEDPQFELEKDVDKVFIKNSAEAIFQLKPPSTQQNTLEATVFVFEGYPVNGAMSAELIKAFEVEDKRREKWIGATEANGESFFFPYKYKVVGATDPLQEYSIVLRLAEQVLIRAEARMNQGKLTEAVEDINVIRTRAGLQPLELTISVEEIIQAIAKERQTELFNEWGHRWLDLKRTGRATAALASLKPDWQPTDELFPIPFEQIQRSPSMANDQNPGY